MVWRRWMSFFCNSFPLSFITQIVCVCRWCYCVNTPLWLSHQGTRTPKRTATFGKRSNSMRRNPNAEVARQGWLHKQVLLLILKPHHHPHRHKQTRSHSLKPELYNPYLSHSLSKTSRHLDAVSRPWFFSSFLFFLQCRQAVVWNSGTSAGLCWQIDVFSTTKVGCVCKCWFMRKFRPREFG